MRQEKKSWALYATALLAVCLTALAVGCGGGKKESAAAVPVKVGYSPGVCNAAIFAAYENGYFREAGLEAEMIQVDAAHISDAVGAGQVDVFQGMASKLVQPMENGLPVVAVTGIHTGCQKVLVPGDSEIRTPADLKGKRVGVPGLADAGTILVKRALYREGIGVTDKNLEVEFRVFNRNDLPQALAKGAVDAIAVGDPVGPVAVREFGFRVLIDNARDVPFSNEYCCLGFVTEKLAKERPEAAAAFVTAVNRAALWVQSHPREAAQLELDHKYVSGNIEMNTELLKSYSFIPSVQGAHDALTAVAKELNVMGLVKAGTAERAFIDRHFVRFPGVPDQPQTEKK